MSGEVTVNNGKVPVPSVILPVWVVDKTNIDEIVIKSGFHTAQSIYEAKRGHN
jgi:D-xylose transport system substrate-binding protein